MPSRESPIDATGPARRTRWRRWAGELAVVVSLVVAVQAWQARDVPSGSAPAFAGPTADGGLGGLGPWRATYPGQAVAVYFWADWCPICKAQETNITALRADRPVLTVATQSGSAADVARVLASRGLDWPTVIDPDGAIAARYGVRGLPALVVVDPRGEVHSVAVGYTTALGMRLRLWRASAGG